jgi:hypothetical protein
MIIMTNKKNLKKNLKYFKYFKSDDEIKTLVFDNECTNS